MTIRSIVVFGLLIVSLSTFAAENPQKLTVVAMTDLHGALEPETVKMQSGEVVQLGGAAMISSYIKVLKAKSQGPVLIVDAGDLFQGTLVSNLAEGKPVIKFYNYLHVAAAAVGNHEFDYGPVGPHSIPMDPSEDPRGALKERIAEANFPFLAANVVDDDGKTPKWLRRSALYIRGNLRVGIVGASTPTTPSTTAIANLGGLHFENPAPYVEAEAKKLRTKFKANVVILAFHGGSGCSDNSPEKQNDLSSCKPGEVFDLMKKLPPGLIDVVIAGHTHQGIVKQVGSTVVLQSYSHGKDIGWADIEYTDTSAKAKIGGFTMVRPGKFLGEDVGPDPKVIDLLAPDFERVRPIKEAPLGVKALTPLTRAYSSESALGNMTADFMRTAVKGADVAVTNGGGLRANIDAGPLTFGDIYALAPFDNRLAGLTIDGQTLGRMVVMGHSGSHGALSWSNLTFTADGCKVTSIQVGGESLDVSKTYHVVTNDFLAGGGSGFDQLKIDPKQVHIMWDGPYNLYDVIANGLKRDAKDISSQDFYNPKDPRQKITGSCDNKR